MVAMDAPRSAERATNSDPRSRLAMEIITRQARMEGAAANFRIRWDDCSRYIQPRKGNIITRNTPGQPQTQNIYDTTAEEALLVYAAGVLSSLTPIGERWALFQPKNKKAPAPVREWFDDATEAVMMLLGMSNFYLGFHESCLDDGCFGTSVLQIDEETDGSSDVPFNVSTAAVGTFTYSESNKGQVDTLFKKWKWTARQCEQEFGRESLGPALLKAVQSSNPADWEREFIVIRAIYPRREFDRGPAMAERRPWAQVYVCVEDQNVLREEGTYEMPMMGCRLLSSNSEVYGRGPGIQAMPEIKMANRMKRDLLVLCNKYADPGWIAGDEQQRIDNRPGGITFYDAAIPNNKPVMLEMKGNVEYAQKMLEEERDQIKRLFYNPMFQMLTSLQEQKREKTAYEVSQMVAEQLVLFSPIFAKIVKEKLNPALHRIFAICLRKGLLRPFPAGFDAFWEYEVEYTSKIALAIKAIQNQSLAAAVQIIQSITPLDTSVAYLLKGRDAARDVLRNVGVRSAWLRSDDEIDAIMAQQAQKQSQLEAAQGAMAASTAVKNLGPGAQAQATKAMSA